MKKSPSFGPNPLQDQHSRFVETGRALGCDEDEAAFDEKLKVIARHKPKEPPAKPEKPSSE